MVGGGCCVHPPSSILALLSDTATAMIWDEGLGALFSHLDSMRRLAAFLQRPVFGKLYLSKDSKRLRCRSHPHTEGWEPELKLPWQSRKVLFLGGQSPQNFPSRHRQRAVVLRAVNNLRFEAVVLTAQRSTRGTRLTVKAKHGIGMHAWKHHRRGTEVCWAHCRFSLFEIIVGVRCV